MDDRLLPLKRTITAKMRRGHDHLSTLQSHTLNHLRTHVNRLRSMEQLIEAVYPDPDFEPGLADDCIRIAIMRLRRQGFNIHTVWGRGYMMVAEPQKEWV